MLTEPLLSEAFNLFSKRFAESADTQFVINDAIPEASVAFVDNFHSHYPEARINVLPTPAQCALLFRIT
jgi:3-hydroxyisobutyrate dehydrogenase